VWAQAVREVTGPLAAQAADARWSSTWPPCFRSSGRPRAWPPLAAGQAYGKIVVTIAEYCGLPGWL
jgi:hypothetical protein